VARNKKHRPPQDTPAPQPEAGRKPGFDYPVIFATAVGSGVLAALVHQVFIATEAIYGEFGPFLYLFGYYFTLIVILFVAMAWFRRRRRGALSFMDILVHSIVICILTAALHSAYDFTTAQLNPTLAEEMLARQEQRIQTALAAQDSILAANQGFGQPAEAARSIKGELTVFLQRLQEQRGYLQTNPPSFADILSRNLIIYLLFSLFWGSITGVLFKHRG
jgi:hypothetical protein